MLGHPPQHPLLARGQQCLHIGRAAAQHIPKRLRLEQQPLAGAQRLNGAVKGRGIFRPLAHVHRYTAVRPDEHTGNGKIVPNRHQRLAIGKIAAVQMQVDVAQRRQGTGQEHHILHQRLAVTPKADHQRKVYVRVAVLVQVSAALDAHGLHPVFAGHGKQIQHRHDVQRMDSTQHRVVHLADEVFQGQLGVKGHIGGHHRAAAALKFPHIVVFRHQVVVNGQRQLLLILHLIIPDQLHQPLGLALLHQAPAQPAQHIFRALFRRQRFAADPFADIGNVILQGLRHHIVLQCRHRH